MTTPTETTSPPPPPADPRARLAVAARELRAAQAIVLDPSCEDSLAATHLATAWQALALATGPQGQHIPPADQPAGSPTCPEGQTIPLGPRPEDRAALPAALVRAIDEVLPAVLAVRGRSPFEPLPWTVPHAALERHCDALARILARHQAPGHAGQARRRRVALGAAGLALALLALRPWQAENLGPWAGTYFKRPSFISSVTQASPSLALSHCCLLGGGTSARAGVAAARRRPAERSMLERRCFIISTWSWRGAREARWGEESGSSGCALDRHEIGRAHV